MKIFYKNRIYDGEVNGNTIHFSNNLFTIVNKIHNNFYEVKNFSSRTCSRFFKDYIKIYDGIIEKYKPTNYFENFDNDELWDMIKNNSRVLINNKCIDKFNIFKKNFEIRFGYCPKEVNCLQIDDPLKSCRLSHQKIIKDAKKDNLPFIVIFEDDAVGIRKTAKKDMINYLKNIPCDCDILTLGTRDFKGYTLIPEEYPFCCLLSNDHKKTDKFSWGGGTQSFIVFNRGYDNAIRHLNNSYADCDMLNKNRECIYRTNYSLFLQASFPRFNYIHNEQEPEIDEISYHDPIKGKLVRPWYNYPEFFKPEDVDDYENSKN